MAARVEGVEDAVDGAAGGGRRDADAEGDRPDAVGVDAQEAGRARVLHGGAHRAAEARLREQEVQQHEDRDRERERVDADDRDLVPEDRPGRVRVAGVGRAVRRLEDRAEDPLDPERERPGDQERELLCALAPERADEHELNRRAEREHERCDDQHGQERIDVQILEQHVAQVCAQDHERPLGHVDDVHDAEDERQPAGHQRVDTPGEHSEDAGLDDDVHEAVTCPRSASAQPAHAARPPSGRPAAASRPPTRRAGRFPAARRSSSSAASLPPSPSCRCAARR